MATKVAEASITCAICLRRFRKPRILPCLHSYCEDCLVEYTHTGTEVMMCPLCQEKVQVPDGDVTKFKLDFRLQSQVEDANHYDKEAGVLSEAPTCNCCRDEADAIAKCKECDQILCRFGMKAHDNLACLRDHSVTLLKEGEILTDRQQEKCMDTEELPIEKRAILVSRVPHLKCSAERIRDRLTIHFQKTRHGGGDVEGVIYPLEGRPQDAVVVFEDKKTCESVLKCHQYVADFKTEVSVEPLPQVFTHVETEINSFYWNLVPRLETEKLIDTLSKIVGKTNLEISKNVLSRVIGTIDQLQIIQNVIVKVAGLTQSSQSSQAVIDSGVFVTNIPFLTNDSEQLKQELKKHFEIEGISLLGSVMCPIKGNSQEAIALFTANEARDGYIRHSDKCFYGETLSVVTLPPVLGKATAVLDRFYQQLITRANTKPLHAKLSEKYELDITLNNGEITGPFMHIVLIPDIWFEVIGLQPRTTSDFESENVDKSLIFSSTESSQNVKLNRATREEEDVISKHVISNDSILKGFHNTTASSDEDHIDDYISVDALTYAYIKKTCPEKLQEITSICSIQIQTPDKERPTEQIASFIPNQSGRSTSANDQTEAREKFLALYQATFFKLKRQSLKCDDVPKGKAERAKEAAENTLNDIIILKEKSQEYVFCGDEKTVAEAIDVFREIADMKPKRRRLKKPSSDVEGMPAVATNWQQNENLPFVFYSPEGIEVIVLNADITKQKVDAIVNAANGRLYHGGGVAGAISRAAGSQLQRDCDRLMAGRANVQVGECVETKSYRLPCRYIIHAVGPTYDSTNAQRFFRSLVDTFTNVLNCAESKQSKTLAIPLISSCNFGGPKETCTNALATAIYTFSSSNKRRCLQQICLVNIDQESTLALQNTLSELYPPHEENKETKAEDPDGLDESFTTLKSSIKYNTDEGIEIVVCKGDITKGGVEVIVNAAEGNLNRGSGVAGAIARAARKKIQDESYQIIAQRKRPLQVGECTVTDGYNLRCKVIHAVGPIFKSFKSKDLFFDMLKKTFLEAIRHANAPIQAKQVAIPLIGSGIFGGPKDLCAKALAEAVKEFSRNEKTLVIKRIYLVNIDEETTDAVRVAIQALFPPGTAADQSKAEKNPVTNEPVHKKNLTDGHHIMSKKGIVLDVLRDDITKQEADVIVNPTSPTLRHNIGVAGAISDAAGVTLQRRCNYILKEERKNNPLSIGDTVVTSAFKLPCKYIIHTLGPAFDALIPNDFRRSLQSTFLNCLKVANSTMHVKTITFPLIGSRKGPTEICASAFVEAIRELDRSELDISLNKITLVTTDEDSYVKVQKNLTANFQPALPQNGVKEHPSAMKSNAHATPPTLDEDTEYVFKTAENVDLVVRTGKIAKEPVDVIINSTDDTLTNNGDTSQSICKEAGPKLQNECKQKMQKRNGFPLKPGENVLTDAYALNCRKVLHVSCPVRKGNQSDGVFAGFLRSTYLACLLYARKELQAKCIAIPLIGSEQESESLCATVTANAVKHFSQQANASTTQLRILFVNSRQTSTTAIKNAFSSQFKLVTETVRDTHKENAKHGQFSSIESRESSHITTGATDEATQQPIKGEKELEMRMTSNQGSNTRSQQYSVSPEPERPNEQASNPTEARRKKRPTDKKSSQRHSQRCQICKDDTKKLHPLESCKHIYCHDCIRNTIAPASACQECGALYGVEWESHLGGKMTYYIKKDIILKGNDTPGTIYMLFSLLPGTQKTDHPRPYSNYYGMVIQAYLPASEEGHGVLQLLRSAFLRGILFQIHLSQTKRGRQLEYVGLADIPLKTEIKGKDGYPDPDYLNRVKAILKAKGIGDEETQV